MARLVFIVLLRSHKNSYIFYLKINKVFKPAGSDIRQTQVFTGYGGYPSNALSGASMPTTAMGTWTRCEAPEMPRAGSSMGELVPRVPSVEMLLVAPESTAL